MGKYTKEKIIILILLVTIIVFILAIPTYYLYQNTRGIIISEASKRAMGVAAATAEFIEQDIESYKKLSEVHDYIEGSYDKDYYNKMQLLLKNIKKSVGAEFVFTEKKLSDTETAYVLDAEDPGSSLFSPLGSVGNMEANELRAFNEGIIIDSNLLYDDVWGKLIKGYAPIIDDRTGEVVGIVGVDFTSIYVIQIIDGIKNIIYVGLFIMIVLITTVASRLMDSRFKSLNTDYLTSLYSKRYYEYYITKAIRDAQTKNRPFSLMMIDVDNFKNINDKYGHPIGDTTLKTVAKTIHTNTRSVDLCFRYGGDEFIVILPDITKKYASMVGERIQEKLLDMTINVTDSESFKITLSIGVAEWSYNMSADELTKHADQAMYISKNSGRNRITIY